MSRKYGLDKGGKTRFRSDYRIESIISECSGKETSTVPDACITSIWDSHREGWVRFMKRFGFTPSNR